MDNAYKSQEIIAAPIRVIQLIYNSGVSPWQGGDVEEKLTYINSWANFGSFLFTVSLWERSRKKQNICFSLRNTAAMIDNSRI